MPAQSTVTTNEPLVLKKHCALVSMRGHLSQVQHAAFNTMLYLAMESPEKDKYICDVPWLREQASYPLGGAHTAAAFVNEIRAITRIGIDIDDCDLLGKVAKVAKTNPEQVLWTRPGLISSISAEEKKNGVINPAQALCTSFNLMADIVLLDDNTFQYSFSSVMKEFCFSPMPYAEINLAQTMKLKKAAAVLMELCIDWSGASIPPMPFKDLRDMLGAADTYRDDSAFLKHCFEPAARVVGERLCLNISLKVTKKIRKRIDTVKLVMSKHFEVAGGAETELTPEGLLELVPEPMRSESISNIITSAITEGYSLERIATNIIYVGNYDDPRDPVKLLRDAINKDYTAAHRKEAELRAKKKAEYVKSVARATRRGAAASAKAARVTKAEQVRQLKVFLAYTGERQASILSFCQRLGAVPLPEMLAYYFSHLDEFKDWQAEETRIEELANSAVVRDVRVVDDDEGEPWQTEEARVEGMASSAAVSDVQVDDDGEICMSEEDWAKWLASNNGRNYTFVDDDDEPLPTV